MYKRQEHLLLAMLREGQGVAAQILQNLNVDVDKAKEKVKELLGDEENEGKMCIRDRGNRGQDKGC